MIDAFEREQREKLAGAFADWTTALDGLSPSRWAEQKRYLPAASTAHPGYFRFELTPYVREVLDCLSVDSPVREVTWMKGAQIGATVGLLENAIGYLIDEVRTAPAMLITADGELAKLRLETYIVPMIQASGLEDRIASSDASNARKTGQTDQKIEWSGGGFLLPFGAQNANKLRSFPIRFLFEDEVDGWPLKVGRDGDPVQLCESRTGGFESSRKIARVSTPTIEGLSKIKAKFLQGDQRYYFVLCLGCGHPQTLRWRRVTSDGEVSGFIWETEGERLIPDSVRYLCEKCGHEHFNDDKTRMLSPDNGAEWRPTAEPVSPDHRSYHLSALYSPVGMLSWASCVGAWREAWDTGRNRLKDNNKLQVFYNNILGETYELRGERVRFQAVSGHRRNAYHYGQIPNRFATEFCGGPVHVVTCAVDVHADSLRVATFGWCRERRGFLLDYKRLDGDSSQLDDAGTWGALRELIDKAEYEADDGRRYKIELTLIDSGYLTDQVYRFAGEYYSGVVPVKGRDVATNVKEFAEFTTPNGVRAYTLTVDLYKDRWSAALRREWNGVEIQPPGHFNAPVDATDEQLKELTAEVKVTTEDGVVWHRTAGVANELWDLTVYASAGLDLIAWSVCTSNQLYVEQGGGLPAIRGPLQFTDWPAFWAYCEQQRPYVAN